MSFNDGFSTKGIPEPVGPVSGNVLVYDGTDWVAGDVSGSGGTATSPGGPEYAVQFNSSSTFSGSSLLVYNYNTNSLSGTTAQFTNLTSSLVSSSDSYVASLVAGGVQYPTADGENGQMLVTDGVGTLSFQYPDVLIKVKNLEATQIDKGTPLYVTASGTSGNVAGVYRADAGNPARMPAACVAFEDIASAAEGTATLAGFIQGVDTSTFASGEEIYVAVGGGYTNIRPTGSALVQPLGYVEKVDNLNGSGVVQGPGHYWELPNITPYHLWVGGANGVPVTADFSSSVNSVISASNKVSSDTSLVSGSDQIINMVSLTQAEYDALTPVSGTFYVIVG